jgi:protein involved in polysaccharide export with SLBB domain
MVPGVMQSVSVLGEVQTPSSLLFERGLRAKDYIALSGGTTRRADEKRTYVVKANGQVMLRPSRLMALMKHGDDELQPGDTIIVPADLEQVRPIPLWTSVSTIIYNLAVGAAAVSSF